MNKLITTTLLVFFIGILSIPIVFSDDDGELGEYKRRFTGVAPISNPVYQNECGECHMAYPPGLLPATSWEKLMAGLEDHFGDNAELDSDTHQVIHDYLTNNNADNSGYRRSRRIVESLDKNTVPVRITETPYFRHEHREIPHKMVKGNEEVRSFSNCNACHAGAERGAFDEDNVRIPGFGRWDD